MGYTISKKFYLGSFIVGTIASWVILFTGEGIAILIFGLPVGLYLLYVFITFHQEMWLPIQDDHVRTTPGKAAWFLLIPIFNLYWYFIVYPGFVEDYNHYIKRREFHTIEKLSEFPFGWYAILHIVFVCIECGYYIGMIPVLLFAKDIEKSSHEILTVMFAISYIAIPFFLVYLVFFLMIVSRVCDAVNALTSRPTRKKTVPVEAGDRGSIGESNADA